MKPDIMTYGSGVFGSALHGGCRSFIAMSPIVKN